MANAMLSKLQRRTGAGRFVRSSAEQHDFAIASDLAVPTFEFFWRDLDCSGEGARVAQYIERMTQVNDDDLLARFEFVLQLIGSDAVALDLSKEELALAPAIQDVGDDAGGKQNQTISTEALYVIIGAIELLAEDEASPGEGACP